MTECPWEFDRYGYYSKVMGGSAFALFISYRHYKESVSSAIIVLNQITAALDSSSTKEVLIRLNKPGTTQENGSKPSTSCSKGGDEKRVK